MLLPTLKRHDFVKNFVEKLCLILSGSGTGAEPEPKLSKKKRLEEIC
jgi:hypothetical protein